MGHSDDLSIYSGSVYQARYDEDGRKEESDDLGDLDMVIKDGEVTPRSVKKPKPPPAKVDAPIETPTKKRRGRKKTTTEETTYQVTLEGPFGEARIDAIGVSQPLKKDGIALVLLSGPNGFSFIPPPSTDVFTATYKGRSTRVVHVGLRSPSPTGEGELLILLGVHDERV